MKLLHPLVVTCSLVVAGCGVQLSPVAPTGAASSGLNLSASEATAHGAQATNLRIDESGGGGGSECLPPLVCPPGDTWEFPMTAWVRASGNYMIGSVTRTGTSATGFSIEGGLSGFFFTVGDSGVVQTLGRFDSAHFQLSLDGDRADVSMNLSALDSTRVLDVSGKGVVTDRSDGLCDQSRSRTRTFNITLAIPKLGRTDIYLAQMVGCTP